MIYGAMLAGGSGTRVKSSKYQSSLSRSEVSRS